MARITPAADFSFDLKDYEAYEAVLAEDPKPSQGSEQFGSERRLELSWELQDGTLLRDWLGLRLGRQSGGQVSKLRSLLNAACERKDSEAVAWFDDETFEWGYSSDGPPANKLQKSVTRVQLRGKTISKFDAEGHEHRTFRITVYQSTIPF